VTAAARGLACVALLLAAPQTAASAAAARGQSLNLNVGVTSLYDNNFLEFSSNQLRDFASGSHPLRYAVQSTDDLILEPELALTWELDQGAGRRHALRLRGTGDFHATNGTADFRAWSGRWTESFRRDRRFSAGYYRLPGYYLRQLRDEDLPAALGDARYQRAELDLQILSASWRQGVGRRARVGLAYQHEDRAYVAAFRERDSGTHQGEIQVSWTHLPKRAELDLRVGYRSSQARGTDGDEVGGVRDDDDVSYHGFEGGANYGEEFGRRGRWRVGGDLGYELETRRYESTLASDPYHHGRSDVLNAFQAGVRARHSPHWGFRAFYRFVHNTASLGTTAPPGSDRGTFNTNQVGVSIEWSGDLWRQSKADADAGEGQP
jgi:hypothetical protein